MKASLTAMLFFVIWAPPSGQQRATDVDGWQGAKWDMSLEQIKAAINYPIEAYPEFKNVFRITRSIEINSIPVSVSFQMPDDKLRLVTLKVDKSYGRSLAFDSLKQSLIEKYGKPTDEESKTEHPIPGNNEITDVRRTVLWSFPSTSIILDWGEYKSSGNVFVLYKKVDKKTPL
jgi:hypothetical protein